MFVVLGPSGSGKSTLMKILMNPPKPNAVSKENCTNPHIEHIELPYTLPTVGTNICDIKVGKKKTITLRESGGTMAPIWNSYYKEAKGIIFVIDISQLTGLSCSSVLLSDVLSSPDTHDLQILIVLNKTDIPCQTSLIEIKYLLGLEELVKHSPQNIEIVDCSCREKGGNIDRILLWLSKN